MFMRFFTFIAICMLCSSLVANPLEPHKVISLSTLVNSSKNTIKNPFDVLNHEIATSKKPVIVKFYRRNCPPCTKMAGIVDQVAAKLAGKIYFIDVNIDEFPEIAQSKKYRIFSLPTLIYFKDNKEIARYAGALSPNQLKETIKNAFNLE